MLKTFLKATSPYNQVAGGSKHVLDHLQLGAFYFRKTEYEFFLSQLEYLLGTPLESFFDWYFAGVIAPCKKCSEAPYRCGCEQFDDNELPEMRDRDWWKERRHQTSDVPEIDGWTNALFTQAKAQREAAAKSEAVNQLGAGSA